MLIGIVDFEGRKHIHLTNELELNGVRVIRGSYEEVKREMKESPHRLLFAWDNPTLLEDGLADKVDKVLHVGYFYKAMSPKEQETEAERLEKKLLHYIVFPPCDIRDKTPESKERHEEHFALSIKRMVNRWMQETEGREILTDKQMVRIAQKMIEKSDLPILLGVYATDYSAAARYIYEKNQIVINPLMLNEAHTSLETYQLIIAHELGHAADPDLPNLNVEKNKWKRIAMHEAKTNKEFEEAFLNYTEAVGKSERNATVYGRQFVPKDIPMKLFEESERQNMRGYAMKFRAEQNHFQKMLENRINIT